MKIKVKYTMDDLCRICLTVSDEIMLKFSEDNSFLQKIQACLPVTIVINKSLPNQICKLCVEKVEEINEFHKKVKENDHLLNEYLKNGKDLKSFYSKLKNKTVIKKEFEVVFDYSDDNSVINHDFDDDDVKENTVKIENINSEITNNVETSNNKIKDINNSNNTSGDEISLSVLKQEKDIESKAKKKLSKVITKGKLNDDDSNLKHDPLKCLMCFGILDSQINLYRHYNKEHYNNTKVPEGECLTVYSDSGVMYRCSICGKEYSKKKSTIRHLVVHTDERPFYCNLCGRTYKTIQQIIQHGKVHSGIKLYCKFGCGHSSAYPGAMKDHERRHHKQVENKYKCEKCGKGFEVRTWYEQHQNLHKGLKPFVCDLCGMAYHMAKYLSNHRTNVHPQSARVKKYICTHCSLRCDTMNSLTEHLKEHGIVKPSRFYLCDICGKTYADSEHLKHHKNFEHLGIKPHTCSVCNKAFTKKSNLQVHERTHTGERDYMCGCCGKRFSQQSSLNRHYCREHTGPDAFKCTKCELTFKKRRQFVTHLKTCV